MTATTAGTGSRPMTTPTTTVTRTVADHLAAASSLLNRRPSCAVTVVEPSDTHYYQPCLTLVGAGAY